MTDVLQLRDYFNSALAGLLLVAWAVASPLVPLEPLPAEQGIPQVHQGYRSIPLHVHEHAGVSRTNHPVRSGIPFPDGAIHRTDQLCLVDEQGHPVAAQFDVLSRWWDFSEPRGKVEDHSIRWVAVGFLTDLQAHQSRTYRLQFGDVPGAQFDEIDVSENDAKQLTVHTGKLRASFDKQSGRLLQIKTLSQTGEQRDQLADASQLFVEVNGYRPRAGGLWTTLTKLNQSSQWRFALAKQANAQAFAAPTIDDSNWKPIDPMEPWEMHGHRQHDGEGWFRTRLSVDKAWQDRALYLEFRHQKWIGLSDDRALWVYLNGKRIAHITQRGKVNPTDNPDWKQARVRLPWDLLNTHSENVIAVRAFDGGDGMGGILASPRIVTPHDEAIDGPYPDPTGRYVDSESADVKLLSQGPQRTVIQVAGALHKPGKPSLMRYRLAYTFYQNSDLMDVAFTLTNTEDPYLVRIQSAGLTLPLKRRATQTITFPVNVTESDQKKLQGDDARITVFQYHDGEPRYPGYPTLHDTPFNPTYEVRHNNGVLVKRPERMNGWIAANGITLSMRNFWQDYPSAIACDGAGRLTAYMWPDLAGEMDLRMWPDRKDGGWSQLEEDAAADNKLAKQIRAAANHAKGTGEAITPYNAVGTSWARHLRYQFGADQPTSASEIAHAWQEPIFPFVSNQWNCASNAVGVPMHPYDPTNFPVIEGGIESTIAMSRIGHEDWMQIFGMFQRGALRYHVSPINSDSLGLYKINWSRRWFHHESGIASSAVPFMQYLRTGHREHLRFGQSLSNLIVEVALRTNHKMSMETGYTIKHRFTVFGSGNPSHTNIEGITLEYCMTGDERLRYLLNELSAQYRREPIERFTVMGNWLDREHDSPLLCRLLLWHLDGEDWARDAVLDGLRFYAQRDKEGFTNESGATYRRAQMTRMWLRTRDPEFLSRMAEPIPYFVDGSTDRLFDVLQMRRSFYMQYLPFLRTNDPVSREIIEQSIEPEQTNKFRLARLPYPGMMLKAAYDAKLPRARLDFQEHAYTLRRHATGRYEENHAPAEGHNFVTLPLRDVVNESPSALFDLPDQTWRWLGQYQTFNDQVPVFDPKLASGEIGFDFGALSDLAPGWRSGYRRAVWPTFEGTELSYNFTGFPFGATTDMRGVPFELIDPATNQNRSYLRTQAKQSYEIPVNRKVNRLFFLGHVLNGKRIGFGGEVGAYVVRFADGSTKRITLQDGLQVDTWRNANSTALAAKPTTAARMVFNEYRHTVNDMGMLHLNVFELPFDETVDVLSVTLESKIEGFCLLGVSGEVVGTQEQQARLLYDVTEDSPIGFGQPLNAPVENGWYDVTLSLPEYEPADPVHRYMDVQVYVEAQKQLAAVGFCSRFGDSLTFPVQVTDGVLSLVIHANRHVPTSSVISRVQVSPRAEPVSWVSSRKKPKELRRYGWDSDPIAVGSIMGEGLTDYPDRDAVTSDWAYTHGGTFRAQVPNGTYELQILLFAPTGHPAYSVSVNGNYLEPIKLPSQRWRFGDPEQSRAFETIKTNIRIDDGMLSVQLPTGLGRYWWNQIIGVRGMKLTPIDEALVSQDGASGSSDMPTNTNWELVRHETFDKDTLGSKLQVADGKWAVQDGAVRGKGTLFLSGLYPGAQRIVYQCRAEEPCDLSLILSPDWSGFKSGYFVGFGSANNGLSKLMVKGKTVKQWDTVITPGKMHTVVVEREGKTIRKWVDGELVMEFTGNDVLPCRVIGFYTWNPGVFEDVKIYTKRDSD